MAIERSYFVVIKEGTRGDDTEAFIRSALDHEAILKWAYICHDKEYYNEHDMNIRRFGLQYSWADGFPGMEKYSSCDEYIKEYMNQPPFPGDKKEVYWHIFIIGDKDSGTEDIAGWFGKQEHEVQFVWRREDIAINLMRLTQEDKGSRSLERHLYPDSEVRANFDFRDYINNTPIKPRRLRLFERVQPRNKKRKGR